MNRLTFILICLITVALSAEETSLSKTISLRIVNNTNKTIEPFVVVEYTYPDRSSETTSLYNEGDPTLAQGKERVFSISSRLNHKGATSSSIQIIALGYTVYEKLSRKKTTHTHFAVTGESRMKSSYTTNS